MHIDCAGHMVDVTDDATDTVREPGTSLARAEPGWRHPGTPGALPRSAPFLRGTHKDGRFAVANRLGS